MSLRITATLIVCLAGAVVFGIALARPGSTPAAQPAAAPAAAPAEAPAAGTPDAVQDPYANDPGAPAPQDPAAPPAEAAAPPAELVISDFAFSSVTVPAGATVNVVNNDSAPHTATSTDGLFDTGTIDGGGTGALVAPTAPGTYALFCAIHPSMQGQLVVT